MSNFYATDICPFSNSQIYAVSHFLKLHLMTSLIYALTLITLINKSAILYLRIVWGADADMNPDADLSLSYILSIYLHINILQIYILSLNIDSLNTTFHGFCWNRQTTISNYLMNHKKMNEVYCLKEVVTKSGLTAYIFFYSLYLSIRFSINKICS
jgi:hypothetical protein